MYNLLREFDIDPYGVETVYDFGTIFQIESISSICPFCYINELGNHCIYLSTNLVRCYYIYNGAYNQWKSDFLYKYTIAWNCYDLYVKYSYKLNYIIDASFGDNKYMYNIIYERNKQNITKADMEFYKLVKFEIL
jgi:hypothetical protein